MNGSQTWLGAVDIGFLDEKEREAILNVLRRDEKLRVAEEYRIQKLRNELRHIRRKGAKQAERTYSIRTCGRCSARTGIIINSPVQCFVCKHKICQDCRFKSSHDNEWRCAVCHKEAKLKAKSGEWFYESMRAEFKSMQGGPDLVKEAVISKPAHFSYNSNNSNSVNQPKITCTPATSESSSRGVGHYKAHSVSASLTSSKETEDTGSSTESRRQTLSRGRRRKYGPAETGSIQSLRQSRSQISDNYESDHSTTSSISLSTNIPPANRHTLPRSSKKSAQQDVYRQTIQQQNRPVARPRNSRQMSTSNPDISASSDDHKGSENDYKFYSMEEEHGDMTPYTLSNPAHYIEHDNPSSNSSHTTDVDRYSDISAIARNIEMEEGYDNKTQENSSKGAADDAFALMPSPTLSKNNFDQFPTEDKPPAPVLKKDKKKSGSLLSLTSKSSKSSFLKRINPLQKHRDISMSVPAINIPEQQSKNTSKKVKPIAENYESESNMSLNREISSSLPGFARSNETLGSIVMNDLTITGDVRFSLKYNHKANVLLINVAECRNIATADRKRKRSDPYVKCYLLPDRSIKRKTVVKKHTTCPVFNQCLKFQVDYSELSTRVLQLSVWNAGTFSRNLFLGQVLLPLDTWELKNTNENWYPLRNRETMTEDLLHAAVYKGDIIISLKYTKKNTSKKGKVLTNYGFLDVMIHQAKNLTPVRSNGSVDAFVRVVLKPDKQFKEKTSVISKTTSPTWNAQFHVPLNQPMEHSSLQMTIYHKDKLSGNTVLGACRLNLGPSHALIDEYGAALRPPPWMDSTNKEAALWRRAIDEAETWVDDTIMLRPVL